jgi:hypothetical protein
MPTNYSPLLKLALPTTGELSGTWGDTVNNNITSMVEQAVAGMATINTWTANSRTLTVADGTTSESRCAMLVFATGAGGTALTAAGTAICPATTKLYIAKNNAAFAVTLKTSAGTGVSVPPQQTMVLMCDGTNVVSASTSTVGGMELLVPVALGAGVNLDLALGNYYSKTVTANTTFSLTNVPVSGNTAQIFVELTNAGAYTISWWNNVRWPNSQAPTYSSNTQASAVDIFQFVTRDGGANWYGQRVGQAYKTLSSVISTSLGNNSFSAGDGGQRIGGIFYNSGTDSFVGVNFFGDIYRATFSGNLSATTGAAGQWRYQGTLSAVPGVGASSQWCLLPGGIVQMAGGGWAILCGSGQIAMTLDGGYTWDVTAGLQAVTGGPVNCIVYSSTLRLYVVGGASGTIYTSPDLYSWTYRASLSGTTFGSNPVNGIAWDGTRFVVVGDAGVAATSTDGVTWTYQGGLISSGYSAIASRNVIFANTRFVVIGGSGAVATSTDGATWTNQTGLAATSFGANPVGNIIWTGSTYVVTGVGGRLATSTDAATWTYSGLLQAQISNTGITSSGVTSDIPTGIAAKSATNWVVGMGSVSGFAVTTDTGTTWTRVTGVPGSYSNVIGYGRLSNSYGTTVHGAINWNGSQWMLGGSAGRIATSTDGTNWTVRSGIQDTYFSATTNVALGAGSYIVNGIAFGGSRYVAVGAGSTQAWVSTDNGVTWTSSTSNLGTALGATTLTMFWCVYDGTNFWTGSNTSRLARSTDGATWTRDLNYQATAAGASQQIQSACVRGSTLMVVGSGANGVAITTNGGTTWTASDPATSAGTTGGAYLACTSNTSLFVIAGLQSTNVAIYTSTDGINWTYRTGLASAGFLSAPYDLCWTGSQFVAVSRGGLMAVSTDAITWTLLPEAQAIPWPAFVSQAIATNRKLAYGRVASNGQKTLVWGDNQVLLSYDN